MPTEKTRLEKFTAGIGFILRHPSLLVPLALNAWVMTVAAAPIMSAECTENGECRVEIPGFFEGFKSSQDIAAMICAPILPNCPPGQLQLPMQMSFGPRASSGMFAEATSSTFEGNVHDCTCRFSGA